MKTQKAEIKITPPKSVHVIAWSKPKYNYRIVAKNGETLLACQQGFENITGLRKNIASVSDLFLNGQSAVEIKIYWTLNSISKKILSIGVITV